MKIVDVTPLNIEIYYNLTQAYEAEFSPLTKKFPDQKGKFALDTEIGGNVKGFLLYIDERKEDIFRVFFLSFIVAFVISFLFFFLLRFNFIFYGLKV